MELKPHMIIRSGDRYGAIVALRTIGDHTSVVVQWTHLSTTQLQSVDYCRERLVNIVPVL